MIHISKISVVCEQRAGKAPAPFSFKAVKKNGEIITGENCVLTSSHSKTRSMNIKWLDSGEIRKLKLIQFIELNGTEVTL